MKKQSIRCISILLFAIILMISIPLASQPVSAHTFDNFNYIIIENGIEITGYTRTNTTVVVPESIHGNPVLSIGNGAFTEWYNRQYLTSITLPDSLISIGDSAFAGCTKLTSIDLPDSLVSIGNSAFAGCEMLTSITLPDSVVGIGKDIILGTAYYNDSTNWIDGLLYLDKHLIQASKSISGDILIKKGTLTIAESAFWDCGLKSIIIPKSVTHINKTAFSACSNLVYITVEEGNSVFHSSGNCLIETKSKTLIAGCQSSIIPSDGSVTKIGDYAFYCCEFSGITDIPPQIFSIPDGIISIGNYAFNGCVWLTSSTIPESFTSLNIPNSVTYIGNEAFMNCYDLTFVSIPDSVNYIGHNAFDNTGYYNNTENWTNGLLYINNHLIAANDTMVQEVSIRNGTKTIADSVFSGFNNLSNITIPNSITYIGRESFYDCSNIKTIYYNGKISQWMNLNNPLTCLEYDEIIYTYMSSFEITSLPIKLKYLENIDSLDVTGLTLCMRYKDNTTEFITSPLLVVHGFDNTKVGTQNIVVTYGGLTDIFVIEVLPQGDVDNNGQVDAADALQALQATTDKITLDGLSETAADVNSDGTVTANDALMILQYATKKITKF